MIALCTSFSRFPDLFESTKDGKSYTKLGLLSDFQTVMFDMDAFGGKHVPVPSAKKVLHFQRLSVIFFYKCRNVWNGRCRRSHEAYDFNALWFITFKLDLWRIYVYHIYMIHNICIYNSNLVDSVQACWQVVGFSSCWFASWVRGAGVGCPFFSLFVCVFVL